MAPFGSYIICATPRSGSTLLCGMLERAGCGRPDSYFGRPWIADFARDLGVAFDGDIDAPDFFRRYLDAVLEVGRAKSDIFGLRIMFATLAELSARLEPMFPGPELQRLERTFGRSLYVHLSRRDKVAQAISLHKAHISGLWHRASDGSELERTAPHRDAGYDPERISALVSELTEQDDGWRQWFAAHGIAPLRLDYEELAEDPNTGLLRVLFALGLDSSRGNDVAPPTMRLADDETAGWAARFRADNPTN